MEIIMKVKCSPAPGATTAATAGHSSLKIVDRHRQLQQHTNTSPYPKSKTPSQISTYIPSPTHKNTNNTTGSSTECLMSTPSPPCTECTVGYCCNLQSCCMPPPPPSSTSQQNLSTQPPPLLPAPVEKQAQQQQFDTAINVNGHLPQEPPTAIEDQPEFVSIDDEKIKQYLMNFGQQRQLYPENTRKISRVISTSSMEANSRPVVYEIIELDDENEREKLKQIKQQAEQNLAAKRLTTNPSISLNFTARQTNSLNISLIPKIPEKTPATKQKSSAEHKIIAEINLIDSSDDDDDDGAAEADACNTTPMDRCGADDNDNGDDDRDNEEDNEYYDDDDDDTLPLAAVSCELECDDDDDEDENGDGDNVNHPTSSANFQEFGNSRTKNANGIAGGYSNDNLIVRWEEYERQRERVFFECYLCHKKVQSSYNLRRHMMIHTGERPFACDMCDRRFREFSDLKKHRRRHAGEPNFICMVCRELPPLENDPIRCINCCTQSKNAVLMAAMKNTEEDEKANNQLKIVKTEKSMVENENVIVLAESPPPPTQQQQQQQSHTLPTKTTATITSVAIIKPVVKTSATKTFVNTPCSSSNASTASDDTKHLLDNMPAVHRQDIYDMGMITRKEFACPLCNRAFGTRHNLKRHYMIHTGEKPFSCSKCRKPFREYSTLKKHMVTHQRDRWYKCMSCPMKFRDFIKFTEHKDSHPDNDGVTIINYGRKYQSSESYSIDSNDYDDDDDGDDSSNGGGAEGANWLECCECGQHFNDIDTYNEHLKKHQNLQIKQISGGDGEVVECD